MRSFCGCWWCDDWSHTAIIRRGKAGKPTEFGHKIWLDEVDGGIITRATVLEANPPEASQLLTGIAHHCRVYGKRGFDRWIGWGILTENLSTIARATATRAQPQTA